MNKIKKLTTLLALTMVTSSAITIPAFAARAQGTIGSSTNPSAAYDYTLRNPVLPWDCVKGYSASTFIVSDSVIDAGFNAYSYIYAESNDHIKKAQKTMYVPQGTNHADTGDIELEGYKDNCHSTHKSVYSAKGINFTKTLNSSL